jgi:hypothetical protein
MGNPPRRTTTKLWLGVGAYALVAGSSLPANAQAPMPQQAPTATHGAGGERGHGGEAGERGQPSEHSAQAQPGQGGEGGEGGSAGAFGGASPDIVFAVRLILIRGHLAVGRELLGAGAPSEALPHFLRPTEEIYPALAPGLRERRAPDFREQLEALARAVREGADRRQIAQRREVVERALDAATRRLPADTGDSAGFIGQVAAVVLREAAEEYEAAVEGDRIAKAVEYQDSRGFMKAAEELLRNHDSALRAKNFAAWREVDDALTRLTQAWPGPRPPERAVLSPGEVSALVSRIELAASDWR